MKKVAGKLKLSLANYRELAAFAQFASDLDESTLRVLERGKRMVELLKQPVNSPIAFQYQVALIYAGINGYLDVLPVESILPFEALLYRKMKDAHADLAAQIVSDKKLTDDIDAALKTLVEETVEEIRLQTAQSA